jgi:hypothetical protein
MASQYDVVSICRQVYKLHSFIIAVSGNVTVNTSMSRSNDQLRVDVNVQEYIQKFPDWVDNEINNNKHSLRSNTKDYGGRTH